jgi:translation initiation factor 2B subunit (eIF-2B alpha/beta/delta family)
MDAELRKAIETNNAMAKEWQALLEKLSPIDPTKGGGARSFAVDFYNKMRWVASTKSANNYLDELRTKVEQLQLDIIQSHKPALSVEQLIELRETEVRRSDKPFRKMTEEEIIKWMPHRRI